MMPSPHIPVLADDVIERLAIQPGDIVLDGTIGFGGHSALMLERLQNRGLLIGMDQDPDAIAYCNTRFAGTDKVKLFSGNFSRFPDALTEFGVTGVTKVLLDLGISSPQLDSSGRGFSFLKTEPLDMRMDTTRSGTAAHILNTYSADRLTFMFQDYGDLRHPDKLVRTLLERRREKPFKTTDDLKEVVKKSFFFRNQRSVMIKTMSQVFQALRIEVNKEFENLSLFLSQLDAWLLPDGVAAVITFHSGEDRLVKRFVMGHKDLYEPVVKGVIPPSQDEIRRNPRAKSAKLRVFRKRNRMPE